jgi:excisionase family DNA binding protein
VTSVTALAPVDSDRPNGQRSSDPQARLLTTKEVAEAMRISNMTVYRLIRTGQLAAVRVGRNYRIRASEIDRYLSARTVRVEGMD